MPHRRDVIAAIGAGTVLATGIGAAQEDEDEAEEGETADPTGQHLAVLTGDREVPPVETDATGTTSVVVDRHGNVHYSLAVAGIENVTMAHVHQGAAGENGPVVQWLHPGSEPGQEPQLLAGEFTGVLHHGEFSPNDFVGPLEDESLETFLDVVADGEAYVNVHTEEHPDGAIRGQLHPIEDVIAALPAPEGADETTGDTPTETPEDTPEEMPEDNATYPGF